MLKFCVMSAHKVLQSKRLSFVIKIMKCTYVDRFNWFQIETFQRAVTFINESTMNNLYSRRTAAQRTCGFETIVFFFVMCNLMYDLWHRFSFTYFEHEIQKCTRAELKDKLAISVWHNESFQKPNQPVTQNRFKQIKQILTVDGNGSCKF